MSTRLTDVKLRAWLKRRPPKRFASPDGAVPGLSLRVGPGALAWSLKLRVKGEGGVTARGHQRAGKVHRLTLGEYPAVTLEAARSLANTYLDQAKQGINPVHALEGAATLRGLTIKALSESFLEDYVKMKELRALAKYSGTIRVHIRPRLGEVNAELLTREQVRATVKQVMVPRARGAGPKDRPRGGKEAARTMLGVLRHMITWGMEEAKLKRKDNPVSGMEKNLPKKKKGERVLSRDEAKTAWRAAGTLGYPFGPVFRLILLTGCRQGEWSRCTRSCIDLEEALLVLPSAAYKSDHVHVVPLVPEAVTILRQVLTDNSTESGEYIFSGTDGRRPLSGWSKAQNRMERAVCTVSGNRVVKRWTPHDLRRTVATRIAEALGIGGEQLIEKVLGHSDNSVTAIYNRYGYVKEMRKVLMQWMGELLIDKPFEIHCNAASANPAPSTKTAPLLDQAA